MPLVAANRPVAVTLTFQDRDGNKRTSTVTFPSTLTIADILANLAATEAAMGAMSNAYIVDGTVTIDLMQSTVMADLPPESSDVERKGSIVYKTSAGTYAKFEVPSIDPGIVVDGSNVLNRASPAFIAYNTFMLNGWPGAGNGPVTGAGLDLVELFSAKKMHRGSSKG